MKKIDDDFSGIRGSIPPQLFPLVDCNNMAAQTDEFVKFIDEIAHDFIANISVTDFLYHNRDMNIKAPRRLFGQDVNFSYVGHGAYGAVFKMEIAGHVFALKINRLPVTGYVDMVAFDVYKRARNLVNKPYIGSVFMHNNAKHSWIISDYVESSRADSFERAQEKFFFAMMSKGIDYSDLYTHGNIKDGKVVDYGGLGRRHPNLARADIDMVKKFLHFMRTDDVAGFDALAATAVQKHPTVIRYMFIQMTIFSQDMPSKFIKFRRILDKYNTLYREMQSNARE